MKIDFRWIFTISILTTIMYSCKTSGKLAAPATQFSFLIGNWIGESAEGNTRQEIWSKSKKGGLTSVSFVIQDRRDTISKDGAELQIKGNDFYYVPSTYIGYQLAIPYRITSYTDSTFTAENLKQQFPKQIRYHLKSKSKLVVIMDNGNKQKGDRFVFTDRRH